MADLLQIKYIKPKKMKIDQVRLELLNALRAEGAEVKKELAPTVATWTGDKPRFDSIISLTGGGASVLTGPTGSQMAVKKFTWADEGTRPHIIRARRSYLFFRSEGFKAKTKVGNLRSGRGRAAGGPLRVAKQVRHPGTVARGWIPLLQKRRGPKFTRRMVAAMQKGAKSIY